MSAFLVGDETITKILDMMARPSPLIWDAGRPHGQPAKWFDALGRDMLMLNHRALFARYRDEVPNHIEYTYPSKWSETQPIAAYKALQCWLYQCSEGNCDEDRLYLRAVQWQAELGSNIISKLPEYEAAPWG